MSQFRQQITLSNSTLNLNFPTNPQWTSPEAAYVNEGIDLTTAQHTVSYGSVISPKVVQFRLISGDLVEISYDNGVTWTQAISGEGDATTCRLNTEALREISTFTCEADVAGSLGGDHLVLADRNGTVWPWFNVDGLSSPPAVTTERLIEVPIVTNDNAIAIAAALAAALLADGEFSAVSDGVSLVTVTDTHIGARANATAGTTGWTTVATTQEGAAAPVIKLRSKSTSTVMATILPF